MEDTSHEHPISRPTSDILDTSHGSHNIALHLLMIIDSLI